MTFNNILAARERLRGHSSVTPVFTSRTLNRLVGAEVFLKCENLQRGGSFKFRGAYNLMAQLSPEQKMKGVVAFSSGNHAQGVAMAAQLLETKATIVMPRNVSTTKQAATIDYGATVILCDASEREKIATEFQTNHGCTMIPPFDHPEIIAGQGTAALEMMEQTGPLDCVLAPCGGGGLLSGTALAAKGIAPTCKVIGVEPELTDDATRSFQTRTLQRVRDSQTIADGTRTPCLGKLTFPLILNHVDEMATVSEAAIAEAVRFLFYRMKLVVEPSGALPIAALLSKKTSAKGRVGIILSGGNIDGAVMAQVLQTAGI